MSAVLVNTSTSAIFCKSLEQDKNKKNAHNSCVWFVKNKQYSIINIARGAQFLTWYQSFSFFSIKPRQCLLPQTNKETVTTPPQQSDAIFTDFWWLHLQSGVTEKWWPDGNWHLSVKKPWRSRSGTCLKKYHYFPLLPFSGALLYVLDTPIENGPHYYWQKERS